MIHIIDYGVGNIQAFVNMFKRLGIDACRTQNARELTGVSKIILPGVGDFDHAMSLLNSSGMRDTLDHLVLAQQIPVLGVCVGMQMLADMSEEGVEAGLGWIKGRVVSFGNNAVTTGLPLPHMGWNDVMPRNTKTIFRDFGQDSRFYFLHSYYFECRNESDCLASSTYGNEFSCAVERGNVMGVQFHPEKSHHWGMNLLKNFAEL